MNTIKHYNMKEIIAEYGHSIVKKWLDKELHLFNI